MTMMDDDDRFGIPSELHSDGGPQFTSRKFKEFSQTWSFQHKFSSPYYPRSNGMVERHIQTIKRMMKKCIEDKKDPFLALLEYRNTPISDKIESPNQILLGHKTKGLLPDIKIKPSLPKENVYSELLKRQESQKQYYDRQTQSLKPFNVGDKVLIKNFQDSTYDRLAKVIGHSDKPRSYDLLTESGNTINRNRFHLKRSSKDSKFNEGRDYEVDFPDSVDDNMENVIEKDARKEMKVDLGNDNSTISSPESSLLQSAEKCKMSSKGRVIKVPTYLSDYVHGYK